MGDRCKIYSIVGNTKKQGHPKTDGIANELSKLTNMPADKELLKDELQEAEKIRLIEKALANREDTPAFEWRSLAPEQGQFRSLPIISLF